MFSLVSLVISLAAIILVLAQRFSTHKIEWKPVEFGELKEEEKFKDEDEEEKLLAEAVELTKKARAKKSQDPLDEILETNNF